MTSRPAAPSRRPSPAAPRGGPAFPLASPWRSCHIILLLFSPYLELLSRQFRPRARLPRLSCVWYPQVRGTFFGASVCVCVCVCVYMCVCVWGDCRGARGEPIRGEGRKPQSSPVSGCFSPPALSCLRAPRQRWRHRALLAGDSALELGAARTPLLRLPVPAGVRMPGRLIPTY